MAKSKIQAVIDFATSGVGSSTKDVGKIGKAGREASSAVDLLNKRIAQIGKGVAISATVDSFRMMGSAVSFVKDTVGGAVSAFTSFISGQAQAGDNAAKLARSLGVTVSEFEKLDYVAQRGGLSSQEFETVLKKFSTTVGKAAAGEAKYQQMFNAMGVSLKDRNGKLKSNAALMLEVADVYGKLTNAQDKNRISAELFGRTATKMSTVLEGGSKGLLALMDRREKLGGLLTPEDAKNAEDFDDKMLDVSKAVESLQRRVAFTLMPSVNKLLDTVLNWWTTNGERMLDKIGVWSDRFADFIGGAADKFPAFADGLGVVYDVVSGLVEEFGVGNAAVAALVATVSAAAVPALAAASAAAAALGVSLGTVVPVIAGIAGWAVAIKETIENWDLLMSASGEDWIFVFKEIKNEIKEIVDWWRQVPVIGSLIEAISPKVQFEKPPENIWGSGAPVTASAAQRVNQVQQERDPAGAMVMREYSESKSTTTNKLFVDFSGMPRGVSVAPAPGFDSGVVDYRAGYVFGE